MERSLREVIGHIVCCRTTFHETTETSFVESSQEVILDLSDQKLQKLPVHIGNDPSFCKATEINLNRNEFEKLENLSNFPNAIKLYAANNKLYRMVAVSPLNNLRILDLSHNNIKLIEGLRELKFLEHLNLSDNRLKDVDLTTCSLNLLKTLDLSYNIMTSIPRINNLNKLERLFLDHNKITSLSDANRHLPQTIEYLTLEGNLLTDLSQLTIIYNLNLLELTIKGNPCIEESNLGDFYRIYILNLFFRLKLLDGKPFTEVETVKAEWMYSHGHGRRFRAGSHKELVSYLHLTKDAELDNDKINLIILKSRELGAKLLPAIDSTSSTHLMSQSLDPTIFQSPRETILDTGSLSRSLHCTPISSGQEIPAPLPAATKLVPVPESLISPMVTNIPEIPALNAKRCDQSQEIVSYSPSEMFSTSKLISGAEETLSSSTLDSIKSIAEVARVRKTHSGDRVSAVSLTISSESIRPNTPHSSTSSSRSGPTVFPHNEPAVEGKASTESCNSDFQTCNSESSKSETETETLTMHKISDMLTSIECRMSDTERGSILDSAATTIQKCWRGHSIRSRSPLTPVTLDRLFESLLKLKEDVKQGQEYLRSMQDISRLHLSATSKIWQKFLELEARENETSITLANLITKIDSFSAKSKELQALGVEHTLAMERLLKKMESIADKAEATETQVNSQGILMENLKKKLDLITEKFESLLCKMDVKPQLEPQRSSMSFPNTTIEPNDETATLSARPSSLALSSTFPNQPSSEESIRFGEAPKEDNDHA